MCLKCYHIQIGYLVDPKIIFKYFWETGVSKSNLKIENLLSILKKNIKNKNSKFLKWHAMMHHY